ncbi:Tetratricopeptide (TPR) repeat [Candidatus Methanophagaceae archaeon]|jgi:tetratricopeptide (TPR) repeat protein|nr:Tetratricopeptide (TPR) repeat [Methanophagales archaeon]
MYCQKCGKENPEDERSCMHCRADLSGYKVEISPKIDVSPKINISTMDREQISLLVEDTLSKALEKAHTFKDTQAKEVTPEEQQAVSTLQKIAEELDRMQGGMETGCLSKCLSKYDPHDLDSGVKFLDEFWEIGSGTLDTGGKNAILVLKGGILLELGRYREALVCWDKGLEINPQEVAWWFNKGQTFISLKRYTEAVRCFNKVLDINPEYDLAFAEKGFVILLQRGEFIRKLSEGKMSKEEFELVKSKEHELAEEAGKYTNKALKINPQLEWAWLLKSMVAEDPNEIILCIEKALEINPRSADALFCMGRLKRILAEGLIDFKDGTIETESLSEYKSMLWEAIDLYDKALEIAPNDAKILKERKKLLKELKKLQ